MDETQEDIQSPINLDEEVLHLNEDSCRGDLPIPALEEEIALEVRYMSMG